MKRNIFFLILAHLKAYFYISYVHVSYGFFSSLKVCRLRHYGISIEHNFKGKSRCIALLCFLIYLIYFDARCQNMTKPSSFFMKNMFSNILEIKYLVFFPCGHLQYPWRKFLCLEAFQPQISPKLSGRDPRYECFGDERSLGFSVCLSKFHWLKFP